MRVKANKTKFDNETLHDIFSFVKPNNVKSTKVDLYIGGTKWGIRKGRMYTKNSHGGNLIHLNVTNNSKLFPTKIRRSDKHLKRGYLRTGILLNPEEALVEVMAHELRHVHQENKKHKTKVRGRRRERFSEKDADIYAIQMIRKWRKSQPILVHDPSPLFK